MKHPVCETCLKITSRCQCSAKENKKRLPLCEYRDAVGTFCGKEYRFTIPVPGQLPLTTPSKGSSQWQRLCEEHYAFEQPDAWHDEKMQEHKEKLESRYGKFSFHAGKDMQAHCMKIITDITGNNKLANELLKRAKKMVGVE